jgi:hypothetical protein
MVSAVKATQLAGESPSRLPSLPSMVPSHAASSPRSSSADRRVPPNAKPPRAPGATRIPESNCPIRRLYRDLLDARFYLIKFRRLFAQPLDGDGKLLPYMAQKMAGTRSRRTEASN